MFSITADLKKRKTSELIVFPFWEGPKGAKPAADLADLKKGVKPPLDEKDFQGELKETALVYLSSSIEKRCLILGLGKHGDVSVERLRQAYAEAVKVAQQMALSKISVVFPSIVELGSLKENEAIEGVCEGLLLPNYRWEDLQTLAEETILLKKIQLIGILPKKMNEVKKWEAIAEGVHFARDLINGNADDVTPQFLGSAAKKVAASFSTVTATVFDKKRILKEKLGLLEAVSRGSAKDPAFIILSHKGAPKSKDHTVLVGKGVTYDTGGLNLKPTGSMETMRDDMSGAATALSTVATAAALKLKCNVTAVIPTTENGIDAKSFKPGDVYTGYSGMSVEIGNTDAEGRLILADALAYSVKKLKPTRMIDLATLTGAAIVALGHELAALFSNDEKLAEKLLDAGEASSETLWRLPLFASYNKKLKSSVADINNTGGRAAGCVTAALFLQNFVGKVSWAHIDIAGPAFQSSEIGYWPKNGVGFGVRLLVHFLSNLK